MLLDIITYFPTVFRFSLFLSGHSSQSPSRILFLTCFLNISVLQSRASLQYRRPGFDPWVEKIRGRRNWPPTPVFLAWEIPWTEEPGRLQSMGSIESDTTEQLIFSHPTSTWNVATLKVTFPSSLFTNTHSNLQPRFLRLTSYTVSKWAPDCVDSMSWGCLESVSSLHPPPEI